MTAAKRKPAPTEPSPADAWKLPEPRLHELPSGLAMRLRQGPCMNRLVREGIIPNPLLGVVVEEKDGEQQADIDWKSREEHKAAIVCAMASDPQVTMEPLEGSVLFDSLDERDVEYIIVVAQEGTADLATFRG